MSQACSSAQSPARRRPDGTWPVRASTRLPRGHSSRCRTTLCRPAASGHGLRPCSWGPWAHLCAHSQAVLPPTDGRSTAPSLRALFHTLVRTCRRRRWHHQLPMSLARRPRTHQAAESQSGSRDQNTYEDPCWAPHDCRCGWECAKAAIAGHCRSVYRLGSYRPSGSSQSARNGRGKRAAGPWEAAA